MSWLDQILAVFRSPSADVLAVLELQAARRELLAAQSAQEWASAAVQYNQDRVARLSLLVSEVQQ